MIRRVESIPRLPPRSAEGHKGTFGTSLIIGGSRGMSGAPALAGLASLRSGCGLVFVACPIGIQPIVAAFEASYLTLGLAEDAAGRLSSDANSELDSQLEKTDAVAIGPGLGQSTGLASFVADCYRMISVPAVFDADALNLLSQQKEEWPANEGPRILTPHPGEMSRLTGKTIAEIEKDREEAAVELAQKKNCVVVLKGSQTVVTDGETLYLNTTGNSGLATGGSGDVLTGVIVSLLAQGIQPFLAAQLGVYFHGLAGDLAAGKLGARGVIASDLPLGVAEAMHHAV